MSDEPLYSPRTAIKGNATKNPWEQDIAPMICFQLESGKRLILPYHSLETVENIEHEFLFTFSRFVVTILLKSNTLNTKDLRRCIQRHMLLEISHVAGQIEITVSERNHEEEI